MRMGISRSVGSRKKCWPVICCYPWASPCMIPDTQECLGCWCLGQILSICSAIFTHQLSLSCSHLQGLNCSTVSMCSLSSSFLLSLANREPLWLMIGKGEYTIRAFTPWASFLRVTLDWPCLLTSASSFFLGAGHCPFLIPLDSPFPFFL